MEFVKNNCLQEWCIINNKHYLLEEWDTIKNAPLSPSDISFGSEKMIWWNCNKCGHIWTTKCASRTHGSQCPRCAKKRQVEKTQQTKINNRGTLFEKNPNLCNEWNYELNQGNRPQDFCAGSNVKVWWICPECKNSYESRISSRTHGSACPLCKTKKSIKTKISKSGSLFDTHPELEEEWQNAKNGNLSIREITGNSNKNYWWKCIKGHEWSASASTRAKGHSCPYCSGRFATVENNLAILAPDLVKEWHQTKNGDLIPSDVSPYSGKKAWWVCNRGHEWQASISNRYQGRGCAQCSAELRSSFPEQVIYFYLSKYYEVENRNKYFGWELDLYLPQYNIGIEYDGVSYHTKEILKEREQRKNKDIKAGGIDLIRIKESFEKQCIIDQTIYFLVDSKYVNFRFAIEMLFDLLAQKTGKIFSEAFDIDSDRIEIMAGYLQMDKKNSFAEHYPDLKILWDFNKNMNLKPENFRAMSNRKVWWKCPVCQGSWEESVINLAKGNRCPYCSNHRVLIGFNDLNTSYPFLAAEWHPIKNHELLSSEVSSGSNKKVWWKCKNGHEWRATVARRKSNVNCPYCTGTQKIIPLREEQWMKNYEAAKKYFEKYGNLNIKATYISDDGIKIGSWIRTQRVCKKNDDIIIERIQLLDKIGMIWSSTPGTKSGNRKKEY